MRALLVILALAATSRAAILKKEAMEHGPAWKRTVRSPRSVAVELVVAVKQRNLDALEQRLLDVSDPRSPSYGRHLSHDAVNQLVSPSLESISSVVSWLQSAGVPASELRSTPNTDFVVATVPVATAEQLLHTEYWQYLHVATGHTAHRVAESYSLPEELHAHVDFVAPTVRLPDARQPVAKAARRGASNDDGVTPTMLRALYNIGNATGSGNPANKQAVAQYLKQYYAPKDLQTFFDQFYPAASGRTPSAVFGPNDPSDPGMEASLDIEYIMAVGDNIVTEFWSTAGTAPDNPENEPFLQFLINLANTTSPPLVISTSYGDNENSVSFDYASRINAEFQKAGARGLSLLFSSGDGGVAGSQAIPCTTFIPTFPAASPWVTAVGGTGGTNPEVAAYLSSGGFSNYWARAAYQVDAVNQYLTTAQGLPPGNRYNNTGRGFPDVAAQAESFNIVYNGYATPVDGTSCSCPTFSAVVALLNELRINAGKAPLGFLNPLIYANPQAFNDITKGSNPGCSTKGFPASKGWDPVTGMGTPDYGKLAQVVMALP